MPWLRRIHLLALAGSVWVVAVLSLSDQAPTLVDRLIRWAVVVAVRADPFGALGGLTMTASEARSGIPYGIDTLGHALMWGAVGFVATGLTARVSERLSVLCGLFCLSSLFEAGQQYLSWSRMASLDDLVANGIGLLLGFLAFTAAETIALPHLDRLPHRDSGP